MNLHPHGNGSVVQPPEATVTAAPRRRSALRRRLLWAGGLGLLLVLLVITPPLINANRYRIRIADTMSASLGRPVHLDDVSFHFLPVPGFTLSNLVVSEDPAFGAEPTIRANTVEATLRVSSLWRRPVEFSTVRFVDPSVNLVRNEQGRWNLSDILLHAARVNTAPTGQRHVGSAPRFPYIEATSGRVNVKLATEKLPFSLTEADFALWLPSAKQWRVRLIGHPTRTDTNITDPGTVRLEGELHYADTAQAVPVNFRASWHDAPLGEASRILSGDDLGWRGTLNLDATLAGTLGDAHLASKLTLSGLRRAEFFPSRPLDLQVTCHSGFGLHPTTLTGLQCVLPDDAPQPMLLQAKQLDPLRPGAGLLTVRADAIPVRWGLLWAALFSPRVPTDLTSAGTVDIDLAHGPVQPATPAQERGKHPKLATGGASSMSPVGAGYGWSGHLLIRLPGPVTPGNQDGTSAPAGGNELDWTVVSLPGNDLPFLNLPATQVRLGPNAAITVSAALTTSGYRLAATGNAPSAAMLLPARYLPQLGDGLEQVLPFPFTSTDPLHLAFRCEKAWNTAQTCETGQPVAPPVRTPIANPAPARRDFPSLLTPRNLSPLERSPFSTPRPPSAGH